MPISQRKCQIRTRKVASRPLGRTLPDEVRAGDILECHGVKQQVTYEYGAWGLEREEP